jgi:phage shock protein PspC (stress-responsive transcriptional regulator)
VTAELGAAAAELGVAAAELGAAARRASPPPPVAAPAPAHEPVAPGSSPAEVGRGVFWSRDIGLRVFLALATAVAMALPIGLITGSRTEEGILYLLAILAGAVPLFLVEAWAAPRFELETGLARRLMGLACAGPLVALVTSAEREIWENVVALLTGLVLIDWSERVKPRRHERVSLHLAFTAGLCGFVVGLIATGGDGDNALAAGGTLAGMSLVLNALAPFSGEAHRRDWRWRNHEAEWGRAPRAEGRPNPLAAAAAAPAARPPPAPLHAAPALAASSTGVGKRLLRPREERLLAGVCAGLAARFGIDVAWVRLAFIFAAFVPGGLLLYLALWISMPAVGKRVTVVPSYAATRPGWLRRSLWGLASVAALVGAVIAVAVASEERTWNDDFIFACGFTVFFSLFALLCLVKAVRRVRGTFFRGTVLPVAVIVLASIATSCTLACLTLGLRPDEFAVTAAVAIACGGLALFLSRLILGSVERRMRIDYAAAHPEAGFAHAGWLAFGMLFMILALAVLAGGTVFAVGAVEVLLGPPEYPWPTPLVHFGKQHEHLALALVFFLPGLFALLMSRRKGGPAHVVRGAIGWIAAGLLSGFLSLGLMETLRVSRSADSRFQVQQVRRVHEMDQGIAIMVGLLAVSAVALAWPARVGGTHAGQGAVAADGGEQW